MTNNEDIVSLLGKHLQQIRKEKKLTLEQLAQKSGVSRSMLSQIERGQANPTFGTLWNLSRALGLDMSELVEEFEANGTGQSKIEHVTADNTPRITNIQNGCTLAILGPPEQVGKYEWYEITIQPNGVLDSQPHTQGCREHLTILNGRAQVKSGDQLLTITAGDTARYQGDIPHSISCIGDEILSALLVVMG
ncbi:MAG: transcriptional regulator with XRE-family HTH domain [Cellvibrionaceae bacterium]|jgi:transcriptional regulator with XRE-family HTH domain